MKALTPRQREILEWIRAFIAEKGYSPSFREIAGALGITSTNGVKVNLAAMQKKGAIVYEPKTARTIRVLNDP